MNDDGTSAWSESGFGEPAVLTTVAFSHPPRSATEGGAAASVTVSLSRAAVGELVIPITSEEVSATEMTDYTLSAETLTFAVGASSRTITVTANEDEDSAEESVALGFGELPDGVIAGTPATAAVARPRPLGNRLLGNLRHDDRPAADVVAEVQVIPGGLRSEQRLRTWERV